MKWIGIVGSRKINSQIEQDVRELIRQVVKSGDGVVTGGAPGVDFVASDEALRYDQSARRIRVIIPSSLEDYKVGYLQRIKARKASTKQTDELMSLLDKLKEINPDSLFEMGHKKLDEKAFFARNEEIVKNSDSIVAFHTGNSPGTAYTIKKAEELGIKTEVKKY